MITVRECKYAEVKKFRDLEGEYHKSAHAYATTLADGKFIREIVGLARDVGLRAKSREVDRGGAEGLVQAPSRLMRIMTKGGLL